MTDEPKAGSEIEECAKCPACFGGGHAQACPAALNEITALRAELAAIKAQASDATEYVLAVENRELRAQVKRCHGIMQGLVSNAEDPVDETVVDAHKELSGEFCPGQCTSACDADAAALRAELAQAKEEIAKLREGNQALARISNAVDGDAQVWREELAAEKAARERAEAQIAFHMEERTRDAKDLAKLRADLERAEARVKELESGLPSNYHGWCECYSCRKARGQSQ